MSRPLAFAFLGLLTAFAACAARAASDLERLEFVTRSGVHAFSVEVMRTPAEHEKGLMFRRYLPDGRGMLFDFGRDEAVQMWMKNTYIPLDMVFIGRNGKVVSVAADTEPLSERIIPSGGPVTSVVELNAGVAAKIGLAVGDQVRLPQMRLPASDR